MSLLSDRLKRITVKGVVGGINKTAQYVSSIVIDKSPYGAVYQLGEYLADKRVANGVQEVAGKAVPVYKVSNNKTAVIDLKPEVYIDPRITLQADNKTTEDDLFTKFVKWFFTEG